MTLTIQQAIKYAEKKMLEANVFFGHGTDNAWDEAAWLVLFVLGRPVNQPITDPKTLLNTTEIDILNDILKKRINVNLPLAYIIKSAWFCGLEFYVDERVIIPRSPIAECIYENFEPWVKSDEVTDILDLCTGSGCIALSVAKFMPWVKVDASDYSKAALEVAKINQKRLNLEKQVNFFYSDVFKNIPEKQYDVIVSNPPYVDEHDFNNMSKEFSHEPEMALISGKDGLYVTNKILKKAKKYLKPKGILVVEVGNSQINLLSKSEYPFLWLDFESGGEGVFLLKAEQL